MKIHTFLILILSVLSYSCGNNKLKTDESKLAGIILTQEVQLVNEQEEREKAYAEMLDTLPIGFRFKQERGIDRLYPPKVIDIERNFKNYKNYTLSDVASDIEYVRIEPLPDSTKDTRMCSYFMLDSFIVRHDLLGIHVYNREGGFLRTIIENALTGITIDAKKSQIMTMSGYTKIGSGNVWGNGNQLYYTYLNSFTGQQCVMHCDCDNLNMLLTLPYDLEKPDKIRGLGEVIIDLNHSRPPLMKMNNSVNHLTLSHKFVKDYKVTQLNERTYMESMRGENMLATFSDKGDTLCVFKKYEQLKNYSKKIKRGTDYGFKYQNKGRTILRTNFNDTIFEVIPPNRLLPLYVMNYGQYKVGIQQGVDPSFDLKGKMIPASWGEFNDFLFMSFTKDSYSCPITRKNKSLNMYWAAYSKKAGELTFFKSDSTNYSPEILLNDIDGGLKVWPNYHSINQNGEYVRPVFGKMLKEHVNSKLFTSSTAPIHKKEVLKKLAGQVSGDETILMIVK